MRAHVDKPAETVETPHRRRPRAARRPHPAPRLAPSPRVGTSLKRAQTSANISQLGMAEIHPTPTPPRYAALRHDKAGLSITTRQVIQRLVLAFRAMSSSSLSLSKALPVPRDSMLCTASWSAAGARRSLLAWLCRAMSGWWHSGRWQNARRIPRHSEPRQLYEGAPTGAGA